MNKMAEMSVEGKAALLDRLVYRIAIIFNQESSTVEKMGLITSIGLWLIKFFLSNDAEYEDNECFQMAKTISEGNTLSPN